MSAKRSKKEDGLNAYFTDLANFENMKHHLLTTDDEVFTRWFDKLRMIDGRTTWIFLKQHYDTLTEYQKKCIELTYRRSLKN